MSVQFFRIIHQPGFEHSLHYCIKEKTVVAAPIEIEDSDLMISFSEQFLCPVTQALILLHKQQISDHVCVIVVYDLELLQGQADGVGMAQPGGTLLA